MSSDFAYIIVGSGVAGSTIAAQLLERDPDLPILILEAGPTIPMKDRRFWWDYVIYGRKAYDACEDRDGDNPSVGATPWHSKGSRTMMYGGSTAHWGGWSMRFKPEDFHLKSNTGRGGDWPYGYDTLEPYYCRADEYLSVCGDDQDSAERSAPPGSSRKNDPWRSKPYPLPPYPWTESDGEMIQAFEALRITPGRMPLARYRKCMATGTCKYCPFGARFCGSFVMDDLLAEPRYTRLKYIGMAPVTRLVVDPDSRRRIHTVEYTDPVSGETKSASADRVILCAGAYEVPKLLLLSRSSGWPDGIGNDHDLVGRYAISHPFLSVLGTKDSNEERWIQEFDFPTLMSRTYDTEAYQSNGKIFMMKSAMFPNVDLAQHMIDGLDRSAIDRIVTGPRQVQLSAFMEEMGQFDNRFSLGEGSTRWGLPRTRIEFAHPPDFNERAGNNLDRMEAVIRQMGYRVQERKIGDQDGHHTSSTCRMGKDPSEGVVDADLKVFGTDNLYICSNAVHPTCAAVNPTLTLVAVTLKLVDHLLAQTS